VRPVRRGRLGGFALSLAIHLAVLGVLLWPAAETRPRGASGPPVVRITLVGDPGVAPAARSPSVAASGAGRPPAADGAPPTARPAPAPRPASKSIDKAAPGRSAPAPTVSGAASGAARRGLPLAAAIGPEDPDCPVRQSLETALRRNPRVQGAIARAQGLTTASDGVIVVWNGDWVQSQGEDGKGLAAVREAISLEVAALPAKCLDEPVRGAVLLSFGDGAGLARVAIGGSLWRWSDLLDRAGAGSWRPPGPP
jgi:hypothetical protein